MDSYGLIDNIHVEKANALARYRRFNNIANMLKLIEFFFAVALISWSSTRLPTVLKVAGEYLYACWSYLLNQHVIFLVGNIIVVLCYVLSGHTEVRKESSSLEISEDNRYRSSNLKTIENTTSSNIELVLPPVEELAETNQTVMGEIEDKVVRCENKVMKTGSELEAEMAIKQAAKQIERFQRTQSAKLKREMSTTPRGELRRSVTERRRSAGDEHSTAASFDTVERLSNEEFRLAVEAFISKQQSFIKQQTMVES